MNAFAGPMSVQAYSSRSQNSGARGSAYNAPGAYYTRDHYKIGPNSRQVSYNPNPKVIPAPIPSNLVPYRKEESLKKLAEEDDDPVANKNPQYQEFLARRGKSRITYSFAEPIICIIIILAIIIIWDGINLYYFLIFELPLSFWHSICLTDKQAQIPSSLPPSSSTSSSDEPWYRKKPTVRVGDPIALRTNKGWVKAKVAAIKNGRVGVA